MNRARVLFLLTHQHKGGMERAISNISLALPAEIEQFLGYFGTDSPGYPFKGEVHDFALPPRRGASLISKFVTAIRRAAALRRYVAQARFDAVVSFGESASLYNLLSFHRARRLVSVRVSIDEQFIGVGTYGFLFRGLIRLAYPFADRVVCVSRELQHQVVNRWPKLRSRTQVIYNLYHLESIRRQATEALPSNYSFLEDSPYVLAVGSLTYQKGHDLLLEAVARLKTLGFFRLVIIGSGERRAALEAIARSFGIADRSVFVDFVPNPYPFMSRATVFALPSRYEGFPNVLVEAMASGVPVVACDCPTGPREILGGSEYGVLVAAGSPQALAEGIGRLLTSRSDAEAFRSAGLKRSKDFSADAIAQHWVEAMVPLRPTDFGRHKPSSPVRSTSD